MIGATPIFTIWRHDALNYDADEPRASHSVMFRVTAAAGKMNDRSNTEETADLITGRPGCQNVV